MKKIQIIVGSATGTAQAVAEYIQKEFSAEYSIELNDSANSEHITRDEDELLLFCTSNTGAGDLPDNILPLYIELTHLFPKIAGRKYALINLGDSSFATYGAAGQALDHALKELGAQPVTESLLVDACEEAHPRKAAVEWAKNFL